MKKLSKAEAKNVIRSIMEYENKEPYEAIQTLVARDYKFSSKQDLLDIEAELTSEYSLPEPATEQPNETPSNVINLMNWINKNPNKIPERLWSHCIRFNSVA